MSKLYVLVLMCVPLFQSCESIRTVEVPTEKEINIPGGQIGQNNPLTPDEVFPVDFGEAISAALSQSFSTEGIDSAAVGSLKLTEMSATVRDPEEAGNVVRHLGFLESISFALVEGEELTEIAFSAEGAFDDQPVAYDFELTDAELAPILKASDELNMESDPVLGRRPNFATTIDFKAVMTVVIDPLGAL